MSDSKFGLLSQAFFLRQPDLLRYLARRVGSQDAQDLLQETYLRVRRYATSRVIADPEAFLFKTAVNIARNHRSRRGIPENLAEALPLSKSSDLTPPSIWRAFCGGGNRAVCADAIIASERT
jgi:DNA-directed RNA polymerase specialized sigma24 family protein